MTPLSKTLAQREQPRADPALLAAIVDTTDDAIIAEAVDGLEVLEHLRGDLGMATLHLAVVTSSRSPTDLAAAEAKGADRIIHKPFPPERFAPIVRACAEDSISTRAPPDSLHPPDSGGDTV